MTTIHDLDPLFDEHPSLDASLADFEPGSSELGGSPRFAPNHFRSGATTGAGLYPSHHSGFLSGEGDSDSDKENSPALSAGGYSPPAWRRAKNGARSSGFWDRHDLVLETGNGIGNGESSREVSPEYESADDGEGEKYLEQARRTRLPTGSLSPEKRRSPSPDPYPSGEGDFGTKFGSPAVKKEEVSAEVMPENSNNYIRFAVRAEVQHRTEPFEAFFTWFRNTVAQSRSSLALSILVLLISIASIRALLTPSTPLPVPDLVKVAGLAKAFEPLIYYSENGISQISDLQATGVAVWDLGESVRSTNMTSAPIIVKELDELSESLKTLSLELTRFFANVDGDVDGILIVMDWARRELSHALTLPSSPLFDNLSRLLHHLPIPPSHLLTSLLGSSSATRTRHTLQRTFTEFLSVLEDSINAELSSSLALFSLFEAIDRQFLNLARTVIRESDQQERLESELLSSLWTRVLGPNAADLRKFERNRDLLRNVRQSTVRSKGILVDHNGRLQTLKANLETLRKKLVSPLVRSNDSSMMSLETQIGGLGAVEGHLRMVRENQKSKVMGLLYGQMNRGERRVWVGGDEGWEIEDGKRR